MLAQIVLVLQLLRSGLNLRIDRFAAVGHFGDLFQNDRIVNRLKGILAPCKGAVVLAKASSIIRFGSIFYSEVWLVSNSEQVIVNILCIQILICIRALVLAFFTDSDQIQHRKSVRNTK